MPEKIKNLILESGLSDVAFGVTDANGVVLEYGNPISVYRIASVTKILTSLCVLLAVSEGAITLQDEIGVNGAKLFHLLSHTSGISFDTEKIVLAPPETRRIYSNAGIEIAAGYVEQAVSADLSSYMQKHLLDPLAMKSTYVDGSYAKDGISVLHDLLNLAQELLGQKLLPNLVHDGISQVCCPGLAGVLPGFGRQNPCDFSLGAEIKGSKSPHWTGANNSPGTFGHFGQSGCFIWVDRSAGLACVYLGKNSFGEVHKKLWPHLSDLVLSISGDRG
jgi:CubicO group peptidase (beta-lactamase class C family)